MRGVWEEKYNQGRMDMLVSLVKDGLLTISDASRTANMTEEEFTQYLKREEKENQ